MLSFVSSVSDFQNTVCLVVDHFNLRTSASFLISESLLTKPNNTQNIRALHWSNGVFIGVWVIFSVRIAGRGADT